MQQALQECDGNIDAIGANRRIRSAVVVFLIALASAVLMLKVGAPVWTRFFLILPFQAAVLSFLQGVKRT